MSSWVKSGKANKFRSGDAKCQVAYETFQVFNGYKLLALAAFRRELLTPLSLALRVHMCNSEFIFFNSQSGEDLSLSFFSFPE